VGTALHDEIDHLAKAEWEVWWKAIEAVAGTTRDDSRRQMVFMECRWKACKFQQSEVQKDYPVMVFSTVLGVKSRLGNKLGIKDWESKWEFWKRFVSMHAVVWSWKQQITCMDAPWMERNVSKMQNHELEAAFIHNGMPLPVILLVIKTIILHNSIQSLLFMFNVLRIYLAMTGTCESISQQDGFLGWKTGDKICLPNKIYSIGVVRS